MIDLNFNPDLAKIYHSKSQKIRIMSENWVLKNIYCPSCGNANLNNYENNKPVADFYCENCFSEYELKSKYGLLGSKVINGNFNKMIERITSDSNPNFLFLNYSNDYQVQNLLVIPNTFFTPEIIERRKPLGVTARRAGWIGCNILFNQIPNNGKIYIVKNGICFEKDLIVNYWKRVSFLGSIKLSNRSWLFEIMKCIEELKKSSFKLNELYFFENYLKTKFPFNNNIKPKIRQQLQVLRDKGYLNFTSRGYYKLA